MDIKPDTAVEKQKKEAQPLTQRQFMKVLCTGSDGKPIPEIHIYGTPGGRGDLVSFIPKGTAFKTALSIVDGEHELEPKRK